MDQYTRTLKECRPPPRRIRIESGACIPHLDPDSGSVWLSKFNGDFLVQRYILTKIFTKIQSVFPEIWAKLWKNRSISQC